MKPVPTLTLILLLATAAGTQARVRTTQRQLSTNAPRLERIATQLNGDTIIDDDIPADAIELRGFVKRASDSKESFFVTSNLKQRISGLHLRLRYTTLDGQPLTEREVTIPVDLRPGETKLVAVKSFDIQRMFYYFGGPKPRKAATPFRVAFRLTGYDITIGH